MRPCPARNGAAGAVPGGRAGAEVCHDSVQGATGGPLHIPQAPGARILFISLKRIARPCARIRATRSLRSIVYSARVDAIVRPRTWTCDARLRRPGLAARIAPCRASCWGLGLGHRPSGTASALVLYGARMGARPGGERPDRDERSPV